MIIAYPHLSRKPHQPFYKLATCVNLGGVKEMWYPADKLTIVEWQAVSRQLDTQFKDTMVKKAQKFLYANKVLIREYALPHLAIGPGASFHMVSQSDTLEVGNNADS